MSTLLDVESTKDSESTDITAMREKLGATNYLVTIRATSPRC